MEKERAPFFGVPDTFTRYFSRARLEDFLRTIPVETLLKVKKRLDRPEAKVRDREGCYKLIVSGGPGRGLTLDLRE